MPIVGALLIVAGLVAGSLAAATAYTPRLSTISAGPDVLTLAAPAGRLPEAPDRPAAVPGDARSPVRLDTGLIRRLEDLGVSRVRVKEFSIGRWREAWIFALSMIALAAGGLLVRRTRARGQARTSTDTRPADAASLLESICLDIEHLKHHLEQLPEPRRTAEALARIEAIQSTRLLSFANARTEWLGRYGITGFARLMDAFALGERHLNRAWSAAADDVLDEALAAIDRSLDAFRTATARIQEAPPGSR